ncbi:MAG: hypothetical protein Q9M26_04260, partial [Mariprofundales bacterium]|nr:hypothetical protein [Mariprofundales bacterium]
DFNAKIALRKLINISLLSAEPKIRLKAKSVLGFKKRIHHLHLRKAITDDLKVEAKEQAGSVAFVL